MHAFSPKTICIGIVALGLIGGAAFVGGSVLYANANANRFESEGYILTLAEDENDVVVNQVNRFAGGTRWNQGNTATVSFQNEQGETVSVQYDSFVHYDNGAIAALTDGVLSDLNDYNDGLISAYYIEAGSILTGNDAGYTITGSYNTYEFTDFVWKLSSNQYLFCSPDITVAFADGQRTACEGNYLELTYLDGNGTAIRLTDGVTARQVLAEGCSVLLGNGVVIDCRSGEITSGNITEDNITAEQKLSLGSISIDSSSGMYLDTVSAVKAAPVFNFTLVDGKDGANGIDGKSGESGENGEDGDEGTIGDAGQTGETGSKASSAAIGAVGGTGDPGADGEVEDGQNIYIGRPAVWAGKWDLNNTDLTFGVFYNVTDDVVDFTPGDSPYYYVFDVETGENITGIIPFAGEIPLVAEDVTEQEYQTGTLTAANGLKLNHTYCLAVVDTYKLGNDTYQARVMERVFSTAATDVKADLLYAGTNSFTISAYTDEEQAGDMKIQKLTVTATAPDGTVKSYTFALDENKTQDYFKNLVLDGLSSNTTYAVHMTAEYETYDGDKTYSHTQDLSYNWTTKKQTPEIEGLNLSSDDGYILVRAGGKYDSNTKQYGELKDPDSAIESITFSIYSQSDYQKAIDESRDLSELTPVLSQTEKDNTYSYFKVDGTTILPDALYYAVATYTYSDGSVEFDSTVYDSLNNKSVFGPITTEKASSVSMYFSGSGSGCYNNAADNSEGTSYDVILGSLIVNLNGKAIRVDATHKLTLTVTDHVTYEKTITFTDCEGKKGIIEGSFALPIDLDGLRSSNTYAFILTGDFYDQNLETYEEDANIGTIVLKTDAADTVQIGMRESTTGGVGVDFWLGANGENGYTAGQNEENYYNKTTGKYDAGYDSVEASYSNLSEIVFQLKASTTQNGSLSTIGECTVAVLTSYDGDGVAKTFVPGYSPIYQEFYGKNAFIENEDGMLLNSVGVGSSFVYKFEWTADTKNSGVIDENSEKFKKYQVFQVVVSEVRDYTYSRYLDAQTEAGALIYDYYYTEPGKVYEEEEFYNKIAFDADVVDCNYVARPKDPASLVDRSGYGITVDRVNNATTTSAEQYTDEELLDSTTVALDVQSLFEDDNASTRTLTLYAMTEDKYNSEWDANDTLTTIKERDKFGFRLTLNMTGLTAAPKVRLIMGAYEGEVSDLTLCPTSSDDTGDPDDSENTLNKGDKGYYGYKIESDGTYVVYLSEQIVDADGNKTGETEPYFQRGTNYVFAYDAEMIYNNTSFSYPQDYYTRWVQKPPYNKSTALHSAVVTLYKQEPYIQSILTGSERTGSTNKVYAKDTWQIYMSDPDETAIYQTLQGYYKGDTYTLTGGLFEVGSGGKSSTALYDGELYLTFQLDGDNYTLKYVKDTGSGVTTCTLSKGSSPIKDTAGIQAVLEALVGQMKTEEGVKVTFNNLRSSGITYNWQIGAKLNEAKSDRSTSMVKIVQHNLTAYDDLQLLGDASNTDNTGSITLTSQDDKNPNIQKPSTYLYTVTPSVDSTTNKEMTITLVSSGSEDAVREADLTRVAAVRVTAYYKTSGGETRKIMDSKSNTAAQKGTEKEIWCKLKVNTKADGNPYEFGFDITEFTGNITGGTGTIYFCYDLYYDNGDTGYDTTGQTQYYVIRSIGDTTCYDGSTNKWVDSLGAVESAYMYQLSNDRTLGQTNEGKWKQTYGYKLAGEIVKENRTVNEIFDGSNEGIAEFGRLTKASFTHEYNYESRPVVPQMESLTSYTTKDGMTTESVTLKLINYNLIRYPEHASGEPTIHLYYVLKEADTDKLVAVTVGEEARDGTLEQRDFQVNYSDLEEGTTYKLYVYYKDMRDVSDADKDSYQDSELFAGTNVSYAQGQQLTGEDAVALAEAIESQNTVFKILPESTNVVFTTKAGITVKDVAVSSFGFDGAYMTQELDDDGNVTSVSSGKTLSATITTDYPFDTGNVRVMYAVERKLISDTADDAWKTVLADQELVDLLSGSPTAFDADTAAEVKAVLNPLEPDVKNSFKDYAKNGNVYTATGLSNISIGEDGTETVLEDTGISTIAFTYYPGSKAPIVPGYTYRLKALILKDEGTEGTSSYTRLISVSSSGNEAYGSSKNFTWNQYTYTTQTRLIETTVTEKSQTSITCQLNRNGNGSELYNTWNLADNCYYVRLAKYNTATGKWEIVTTKTVYGNMNGDQTVQNYAFRLENSWFVKFENLEPGAEYRVQCYAIADPDYNNKINITDSDGTPLEEEPVGDNYKMYDVDEYGISNAGTEGTPSNNIYGERGLYQAYFGISSAAEAADLVTNQYGDALDNNSVDYDCGKLVISESAAIRTFSVGETGTVGTNTSRTLDIASNTLTFVFDDAYSLDKLLKVDYTLGRYENNKVVSKVSGSVIKKENQLSLMEGEETNGSGLKLKITDSKFKLESNCTYYVKLVFTYEDGYTESLTKEVKEK